MQIILCKLPPAQNHRIPSPVMLQHRRRPQIPSSSKVDGAGRHFDAFGSEVATASYLVACGAVFWLEFVEVSVELLLRGKTFGVDVHGDVDVGLQNVVVVSTNVFHLFNDIVSAVASHTQG